MTNTASCGVKYLEKNGTAGHTIEEIHIIAEGESQLNLRTHPSSTACASVPDSPAHQLESIMWLRGKKRVKGGILQQK